MSDDELLTMIIFVMLGYFAAKYIRLGDGFTPEDS